MNSKISQLLLIIGGFYLKPFVFLTNRLSRENTFVFKKFDFGDRLFGNIWDFKNYISLAIAYKSVTALIQSLGPIIILSSFADKDWNLLISFCVSLIFLKLIQWVLSRYTIFTYNTICGSLILSSHLFWISRDPIVFATKSSGESIAKLERADRSMFTILNKIIEVLPNYMIQIVVTTIAFGSISYTFGILYLVFILIVILFNTSVSLWKNEFYQSKANKYFDQEKEVSIENLTKYELIRSTYSTPEQIEKSKKAIKYSLFYDMIGWRLWQHGTQVSEIILIVLMCFVAIFISKNPVLATNPVFVGAFLNLFLLVKDMRSLGNDISEYAKAVFNLNKFKLYMTSFGPNTIIKDNQYEIE
jgi:ABC-type multidrug transport system fused ATPase/permease subunit